MSRRSGVRTLSDAMLKSHMKGAKPASVSLIINGIKYKPGVKPARVYPAGSEAQRGATIATNV